MNVFLDTYALIEILRNNQKYEYLRGAKGVFTIFNLVELYYNIIADAGEDEAQRIYLFLKQDVVELDDLSVFEAMKFRRANKKGDFSYADAVGYVYALRHKIPFVTGDEGFRNLANVIFIKK